MRFTVVNTIAIIVVLVATAISSVLMKLAAEAWVAGVSLFPLQEFLSANGTAAAYFFATLLIGILPPVGTIIALRDNTPNVVFATIGAPSIIAMHLSLAWLFQYPMTIWQWGSIGVIVFGALLLRTADPESVDEMLADVVFHEEEKGGSVKASDNMGKNSSGS